jgi:hypothetical protein
MSVSQSIKERSDTRPSCWSITGNPRARHDPLDSQPLAIVISSCGRTVHHSPLRFQQRTVASSLPLSLRSSILRVCAVLKSP